MRKHILTSASISSNLVKEPTLTLQFCFPWIRCFCFRRSQKRAFWNETQCKVCYKILRHSWILSLVALGEIQPKTYPIVQMIGAGTNENDVENKRCTPTQLLRTERQQFLDHGLICDVIQKFGVISGEKGFTIFIYLSVAHFWQRIFFKQIVTNFDITFKFTDIEVVCILIFRVCPTRYVFTLKAYKTWESI